MNKKTIARVGLSGTFASLLAWISVVDAQALAERSAKAGVLDPIVVTASRTPQSLAELLSDVTVIERDEIARAGVESLAELLQRQPGIQITQNGGPGATSGVYLRGANTNQTLVLIDGVRVSSASVGATAIEAIPLEQIERIEIVRGPASSLYGSDAIGGVIQIFTRRGSGAMRASGGIGYGTYDTRSIDGGISGRTGVFTFSVHAGLQDSNGFNAIVNPANFSYDPDRDGYRSESVTASAGLELAAGHALSATYLRNRLNNQFDGGDAFDDRTITTLESGSVELRDRLSSTWVSRLTAAIGIDESVSKTGFGDFPFRTQQRQYAWQHDITLDPGLLTLALERREERVTTDSAFAVTERNTDSATAVYVWRQDPQALQVNLRYDDSSQYGGKTTGSVAYGYRLAPEWRITASAGTGFKAPSFNDLYFPGFSNPELKPETSRSAEIGAHWVRAFDVAGQSIAVEAHAIAWRNRVRDLIVFACDADFNCLPRNIDNATLAGVTIRGDVAFSTVSTLSGSLDLQSPENDANGNLLPRRARRYGVIAWSQQAGPLRLGVELIASSYRYDDAENTRRLPGYARVNVTAEWPIASAWTVYVRGDNVFDREYQLAADYSTGGARFFVGVRGRL
ncbi:MAG TPA: TonB-dependent receptor [Casimicrobiaceae bacterium]|jgi:vitamin B12 transporter